MKAHRWIAVLAVLAWAGPLLAHDFWILPSSFAPEPGTRVGIELFVGEGLRGEALPRNEAKIARFVAVAPDGKERALAGIDGRAPAGWLRPDAAGLWLVGYESRATAIELEAAKFEAYLLEEGLEHVIELRKSRSQCAEPGRELYARSVKSLLAVPGGARSGFERRLGLPLELVTRVDPNTLAAGGKLELELLFRGAPLANALVGCRRAGAPDEEGEARLRTDEHGRVAFTLRERGLHLVRAVHMHEAPPDSAAQWQSWWSSLSFEFTPRSP